MSIEFESANRINLLCETRFAVINPSEVHNPAGASKAICSKPVSNELCCCQCFLLEGLLLPPELDVGNDCYASDPDAKFENFRVLSLGTVCEELGSDEDTVGRILCAYENAQKGLGEIGATLTRYGSAASSFAILHVDFGDDFQAFYRAKKWNCVSIEMELILPDDPDMPYTQVCGDAFPPTVTLTNVACDYEDPVTWCTGYCNYVGQIFGDPVPYGPGTHTHTFACTGPFSVTIKAAGGPGGRGRFDEAGGGGGQGETRVITGYANQSDSITLVIPPAALPLSNGGNATVSGIVSGTAIGGQEGERGSDGGHGGAGGSGGSGGTGTPGANGNDASATIGANGADGGGNPGSGDTGAGPENGDIAEGGGGARGVSGSTGIPGGSGGPGFGTVTQECKQWVVDPDTPDDCRAGECENCPTIDADFYDEHPAPSEDGEGLNIPCTQE